MKDFDEVCPLCGVAVNGPRNLAFDLDYTISGLVDTLLYHFPNILPNMPKIETKDDLQSLLNAILDERVPEDYDQISEAFNDCAAIGYFDDDGATVCEIVDDPIIKFRFPDGQFITTRVVEDPNCGEFRMEVIKKTNSDTGEMEEIREENITRTSARFQKGFGNFFLSKCCLGFLEGWIDRVRLPPMWDGRQLSFVGELWEIFNSREIGRCNSGCFEWLDPGGAEQKLDQTQYYLAGVAYEEIHPAKTAEALINGSDEEEVTKAVYEDYGYWMFVTPHDWPRAPDDLDDLQELSTLGFDVPTRASESSLPFGSLARFSSEILVQIFGWFPTVQTYLNLKLVSKRLHDLVSDAKFTCIVLRAMLQPDPGRGMFWIYPIETQPEESNNFSEAVKSWSTLTSLLSGEDIGEEDIFFRHEFPLIQFVHALHTGNCTRNRKRLWNSVKELEDVWIDYRRNGWRVNRFGAPYPELREE